MTMNDYHRATNAGTAAMDAYLRSQAPVNAPATHHTQHHAPPSPASQPQPRVALWLLCLAVFYVVFVFTNMIAFLLVSKFCIRMANLPCLAVCVAVLVAAAHQIAVQVDFKYLAGFVVKMVLGGTLQMLQ